MTAWMDPLGSAVEQLHWQCGSETSTLVLFTLGNPLKEVGQWQWLLALESKVTFGFRTEKIGRLHDPGPDILQPLSNVLTAVGVSRAPTMSNVPGRGTGL